MTGFGYGKPEKFSGYFTSYSYGLLEGSNMKSGYIFDTTIEYIKVPRFYYERYDKDDYEVRFFRQFGLNISESPI